MKKLIKLIFGFLFFLIIKSLSLFFQIRLGKFPSDRIGPFITTVEILEAKKKEMNIKSIDFWSHNKALEPNKFLGKLVSRQLLFVNHHFYNCINTFLEFFKFNVKKQLFLLRPSTRDTHNLFDKYPSTLKFEDDEIEHAKKILQKQNIDLSKKIVCINVRDSEYLKRIFPNKDMSYHDRRDAEVNDYIEVIKYLLSKDYVVVRMGKFMNHEVNLKDKNFVDYPFVNYQDDILDVFFGYICEFTISTGSGWDSVPFCFRKPILYTNMSSYSKIQLSSKKHMTLFKLAKNKEGQYLKINELLNYDLKLISNIEKKNNNIFSELEYISNTEKDLMDATLEFEQYLKNDYKLSVLQKNFQKRFFLKYDPTLVKDIYGEPAHSNEIKGVISSRFLQNNENILF